ncbi:hypothetical protein LQZ24_06180 [Fructobacillus sp. M1-13]|uniref:Uncharacterized protein n=1 Tax=Fructobacillus papyriferae TaxID=2713171 RepID=A0ABS5QPD0_9LACO|nr:hypothetical protein [Fructobacillus papyriferae]MBS9334931.1 hypothetical protein [Fructobacillus papyriferae]MCD2159585.1 hypothetical protein [Fructobacillus papyriferae]
MELSGETIVDLVDNQSYQENVQDNQAKAAVDLDALFKDFSDLAKEELPARAALNIEGGIEQGGTTLSMELNVINLPLRYKNQEKKLVYVDQAYELNVYLVVDNAHVSKSALKIEKLSSLSAFLDDPDSVLAKAASRFAELLDLIRENQEAAMNESEEQKEAEKEVSKKQSSAKSKK